MNKTFIWYLCAISTSSLPFICYVFNIIEFEILIKSTFIISFLLSIGIVYLYLKSTTLILEKEVISANYEKNIEKLRIKLQILDDVLQKNDELQKIIESQNLSFTSKITSLTNKYNEILYSLKMQKEELIKKCNSMTSSVIRNRNKRKALKTELDYYRSCWKNLHNQTGDSTVIPQKRNFKKKTTIAH